MNPEEPEETKIVELHKLENWKNWEKVFVILKVENREFPVHKQLLTIRSPVFASMLNHDTAEKASGIINIPDCSADDFHQVLRYLYTGDVNTITAENAFGVYYVADKYCIDDLRKHIIEFLKDNLSEDNYLDIYKLSLRHNILDLLEFVTECFCKNMLTVVKTAEWRTFVRENSVAANKLLKCTIKKLKKDGVSRDWRDHRTTVPTDN